MRSRTEYGVLVLVLLLVALISRWGRAEDDVPARPVGAGDSTAEDPVAATGGDDAARREKLKASVKKIAADQTYDIRYKFLAGETVYWTVQHLVTHETRVKETSTAAKSRSVSTKVWKIVKAEPDGNIVLEYSVDNVDMWQHVSGRPEVRYNSLKDAEPPRDYAQVASMIGIPLALVTMDSRGTIINTTYPTAGASPSVAELALPLPKAPVKVGAEWNWPEETRLPLEDKRILRVQMRHVYTLASVDKNIATIGVRTEIITPINDPKIHGRLMERMKKGTAKFDLEMGRFIGMQLDLDETVVGFAGAESLLEYKARFIEEILIGPAPPPTPKPTPTAAKPVKKTAK